MEKIVPVVMSGGSGTRLWPLSRQAYPKQFIALTGGGTLLQNTILRTAGGAFSSPIVIGNDDHRFIIAEQLFAAGIQDATIVLEPSPRNTGPAAVAAAIIAERQQPGSLVLLMPADHVIGKTASFHASVDAGVSVAVEGGIVLFGIPASRPETGYGYICPGRQVKELPLTSAQASAELRVIERFVEKPDRTTAEEYCRNGFLWNSGIFLFSPQQLISEFERFEPDLVCNVRAAVEKGSQHAEFFHLAPEPFSAAKSISIDKGVMERTEHGVVVSADMDWTDVGTWASLWDVTAKDSHSNVVVGDVHSENVARSYLRSDGPTIGIVGLEDLVVVASADAVLVARMDAQQDIAGLIGRLRAEQHPVALEGREVVHTWGTSFLLHTDGRSQLRKLTLRPGASLPKHWHEIRTEHWVVLSGSARAEIDGIERSFIESGAVTIPPGTSHSLSNSGESLLEVIEVQSGASLGENDIHTARPP